MHASTRTRGRALVRSSSTLLTLLLLLQPTRSSSQDEGCDASTLQSAEAIRLRVDLEGSPRATLVGRKQNEEVWGAAVENGRETKVEALVRVGYRPALCELGLGGWSFSLVIEGPLGSHLEAADLAGTDAAARLRNGFATQEIVDPNAGENAGRRGVVAACVLSFDFASSIRPGEELSVLHIAGSVPGASLCGDDAMEDHRGRAPIARFRFVTGDEAPLQGSGLPVSTTASVRGDSLTPSVVHATLRGQCALRNDSEFDVPSKDLGRDVADILLRVVDEAGRDIAFARATRADDLTVTGRVTGVLPRARRAGVFACELGKGTIYQPDASIVPSGLRVAEEGLWAWTSRLPSSPAAGAGAGGESSVDAVPVVISAPPEQQFRRADVNLDRSVDLSDPVFLFSYLFFGGPEPECLDAADSNDSGVVDLSSGIYILNHLFRDAPTPPSPYEECGVDPTEDSLDCANYPAGCPSVTPQDDCAFYGGDLVGGSLVITLPAGRTIFPDAAFTLQFHAVVGDPVRNIDVYVPLELDRELTTVEAAERVCALVENAVCTAVGDGPTCAQFQCTVLIQSGQNPQIRLSFFDTDEGILAGAALVKICP